MKVKCKPPRYDEIYFEGLKALDEMAMGDYDTDIEEDKGQHMIDKGLNQSPTMQGI